MKFAAIALIALFAISYVNAAGITDNTTYKDCQTSVGTLDCSKATTSEEACNTSVLALSACFEETDNKTNCSAENTPDLSTYVSCVSGCVDKVTDSYAKEFLEKSIDCLNGSLLSFVALISFGVIALLF